MAVVKFCHACGAALEADQWGHWCHPGRCRPPVTDPGGSCPWCLTEFQSGHGLFIHMGGSCREGDPHPPKNPPGGRRNCRHCSTTHQRHEHPICGELRYPFAPLAALCEPGRSLAKWIDTTPERIATAEACGLPFDLADRWAVRVGRHPSEVWPSWFDDALSLVDRQKAEGGWRHVWLASLLPERVAA